MRHRSLFQLISGAVFIASLVSFLQPAFVDNKTLTQIIVSLAEPDWSQAFFMRWIIVVLLAASTYVVIVDRIYKNVALTVVQTKFELNLMNEDGSIAEIRREQLLRANRPDATAYSSIHCVDNGTMPRTYISSSLYSPDINISSTMDLFGKDEKGYEALQLFSAPLPYAWFMPLIPIRFLRGDHNNLPKFIRKNVILRRQTIRYVDEYNVKEPVCDFIAQQYIQHNVTVSVRFCGKIPDSLRIRRIRHAAVINVDFDRRENGQVAQVSIDKLSGETLKITW